jgi:integrase/recombinase XerD
MLRDYYKVYKPTVYLFEGRTTGLQYDAQFTANNKTSITKTGITKPVTLHWLRHSATHLLKVALICAIFRLLGHNSSKTTEIYTHVSTKSLQQIKAPLMICKK